MPVQFKGVTQEHQAVRTACGLFDVSHMGELVVSGPVAARAIDALITNDIRKLETGKAFYTVACNASGTILDDLIIYRLADERFLIVCNASNRDKMQAHFRANLDPACQFEDRSDATALLALQGPRAVDVMRALSAEGLVALPRFSVAEAQLAGIDVTAARTGYTGEDGYELFCSMSDVGGLWDTLLEHGAPFGLAPIGLGARDTLRLEARLSLYGHEIDETTNPLEAGLGWVVKLDKGDFLGRDALIAIRDAKPTRRLVGFEMVGRGIARQGYPVLNPSGETIGHVTSGAPGLSVGKNIGLGYVTTPHSALGSRLDIQIRDKTIEAKVCATPFYKRA